ncbi:MAG: hypothetical protein AAF850_06090 [Pseudomonadota bacterium]
MSFGIIELVVSHLLIIGWGVWQMRKMDAMINARKEQSDSVTPDNGSASVQAPIAEARGPESQSS